MKIAICLCTFKRPQGIETVIKSFDSLIQKPDEICVFVVDNDAVNQDGLRMVESMKGRTKYKVFCEVESGIGISRARNRSLQMVKESGIDFDYVAFTDDDVEVSPTWLRDLVRTSDMYEADIVCGKVEPVFSEKPNENILTSGYFLDSFNSAASGTPIMSASTSNLLVKVDIYRNEGYEAFDPYLGTYGGSDQDFLMRMINAGYKAVQCAAAIVYETFPVQRLNEDWILKRNLRCGSTYAHNFKKNFGKFAFYKLAVKKMILYPLRYLNAKLRPTLSNQSRLVDNNGFFYFLFKGHPYEEYKRG